MTSSSRYSLSHHTALLYHDFPHPHLQLSCRGVQQYSKEGERVEEEVQFEHLSPSTSRGKETFATSSLLPNTQYTCNIQSIAGSLSSVPHSDVTFTTEPGSKSPLHLETSGYMCVLPSTDPSRPPMPRVAMEVTHGETVKGFSVEVYKTDNQFGPIRY